MLYGVNVGKNSCKVFIEYDDNRRKNKSWEIFLNDNDFVMFPSTQRYYVTANMSEQLNFIQFKELCMNMSIGCHRH